MPTVAHIVEKIIEQKPFVQEALHQRFHLAGQHLLAAAGDDEVISVADEVDFGPFQDPVDSSWWERLGE